MTMLTTITRSFIGVKKIEERKKDSYVFAYIASYQTVMTKDTTQNAEKAMRKKLLNKKILFRDECIEQIRPIRVRIHRILSDCDDKKVYALFPRRIADRRWCGVCNKRNKKTNLTFYELWSEASRIHR